jgi:hypothetical protein
LKKEGAFLKFDTLFPMNKLKQMDRIEAEQSSRAGLVKFGSKLPITMEILQRINPASYLLEMNGQKSFAESEKLLEPGMKYWGEVTHKRGEKHVVKNLIKQPAFFNQIRDYAYLDAKKVLNSFSQNFGTSFESKFKSELVSQMASSSSREEFTFLNHLLLSMENNVISIPVTYEDRSGMFQYKYGQKQKDKDGKEEVRSLDFYAAFELLGPMKGKVIYYGGETSLNLEVNFEKTAQFLNRTINSSNLPKGLDISIRLVSEDIEPLYSFSPNNILDVTT